MRAGVEFTVGELSNHFVVAELVTEGLGLSLPLKRDKMSLIALRAIMYIERQERCWRLLVWMLKKMKQIRTTTTEIARE